MLEFDGLLGNDFALLFELIMELIGLLEGTSICGVEEDFGGVFFCTG